MIVEACSRVVARFCCGDVATERNFDKSLNESRQEVLAARDTYLTRKMAPVRRASSSWSSLAVCILLRHPLPHTG